jgi:hypothetical protein
VLKEVWAIDLDGGKGGRSLLLSAPIDERWRRQHLRSRAGGSALRRTLGVQLRLVERKLNIRTDGRFYPPEVESAISAFLADCEVAFIVADSPEDARTIENKLIQTLHPSLNVKRS